MDGPTYAVRLRDLEQRIDEWIRTRGPEANHRSHFSWHAALHELMQCDVDAVRRRYERELTILAADSSGFSRKTFEHGIEQRSTSKQNGNRTRRDVLVVAAAAASLALDDLMDR